MNAGSSRWRRIPGLVAVLALSLPLASRPALADCLGQSAFFGNISGLASIQLDLADPAAFWLTYFHEDPSINQGAVPVSLVAIDLGPFGYAPGTAVVFADWAAGLDLQGCPFSLDRLGNGILDDDNVHEVFAFGDSRDVTVVVTGSVGNAFDFDRTSSLSDPFSLLPTWPLLPAVVSATDTTDGVLVELSWGSPVINSDPESAAIASALATQQRIREERQAGSEVFVRTLDDRDGNLLDPHAVVLLQLGAGFQDYSRLAVEVQLSTSARKISAPAFAGPGMGPIPVPLQMSDADVDGDGFSPATGDCDDSQAGVYPGGLEVCDGFDNDCNRRTDDIDVDADGYSACSSDCNDADPTVNPAAWELCNGIDEDCDGRVDEGCRRRRR